MSDQLLKPVTAQRIAKTLNRIIAEDRDGVEDRDEPVQAEGAVSIRLFNGLKVILRGQSEPLKLRSPKTEELLAFLICKETVGREEIIDILWGELKPEKAWKSPQGE